MKKWIITSLTLVLVFTYWLNAVSCKKTYNNNYYSKDSTVIRIVDTTVCHACEFDTTWLRLQKHDSGAVVPAYSMFFALNGFGDTLPHIVYQVDGSGLRLRDCFSRDTALTTPVPALSDTTKDVFKYGLFISTPFPACELVQVDTNDLNTISSLLEVRFININGNSYVPGYYYAAQFENKSVQKLGPGKWRVGAAIATFNPFISTNPNSGHLNVLQIQDTIPTIYINTYWLSPKWGEGTQAHTGTMYYNLWLTTKKKM